MASDWRPGGSMLWGKKPIRLNEQLIHAEEGMGMVKTDHFEKQKRRMRSFLKRFCCLLLCAGVLLGSAFDAAAVSIDIPLIDSAPEEGGFKEENPDPLAAGLANSPAADSPSEEASVHANDKAAGEGLGNPAADLAELINRTAKKAVETLQEADRRRALREKAAAAEPLRDVTQEEVLLYEVPVISPEVPDLETLLFYEYQDRYYLSVQDLAALTRTKYEYRIDDLRFERGAVFWDIALDGSDGIQVLLFDGEYLLEGIPVLYYLGASPSVLENLDYLMIVMPSVTMGEVLMPGWKSYTYTMYDNKAEQGLQLFSNLLGTMIDPQNDHTLLGNLVDFKQTGYQKDALFAIAGVKPSDYPSVVSLNSEEEQELQKILNHFNTTTSVLKVGGDLYDASLEVAKKLNEGRFLRSKARNAFVISKYAQGRNYIADYLSGHITEELTDQVSAKARLNHGATYLGWALEGAFFAAEVASSTGKILQYSYDSRNLYPDVFDDRVLQELGISEAYWKDSALAVSSELNSTPFGTALQEAAGKAKSWGAKKVVEMGMKFLLPGLDFAVDVAGSVENLLFRKDFDAYQANMNANFINEFQGHTLEILQKLLDRLEGQSNVSVKDQDALKAILTLYYREVIAFNEAMVVSLERFGMGSDVNKSIQGLKSSADTAALYLYLVTSWLPSEDPDYSECTDDLLTDEWMEPFLLDVKNNGGAVIGYKDREYYFRYHEESRDTTGLLGYFSYQPGIMNDLMVRTASGEETVLCRVSGYGPLYYCGGRIYFRKDSGTFGSVRMDGTDEVSHSFYNVSLIDGLRGYLVYQDGDVIRYLDRTGTVHTAFDPASFQSGSYYTSTKLLDLRNGQLYFSVVELRKEADKNRIANFYRYSFAEGDLTSLGQVTLPVRMVHGVSLAGRAQKEGLYVSAMCVGGNMGTYWDGALYFVPSEGGTVRAYEFPSEQEYPGYPDFYLLTEEETGKEAGKEESGLKEGKKENGGEGEKGEKADGRQYLYYLNSQKLTSEILGGRYQFFPEGVNRLDTVTGEILHTNEVLCKPLEPVYLNGCILTRLSEASLELTQLLSADEIASLGYPKLEQYEEEPCYQIGDFSVVNDHVYFEIREIREDPEGGLGWRTGYLWDTSKIYLLDIPTGEIQLLYQY